MWRQLVHSIFDLLKDFHCRKSGADYCSTVSCKVFSTCECPSTWPPYSWFSTNNTDCMTFVSSLEPFKFWMVMSNYCSGKYDHRYFYHGLRIVTWAKINALLETLAHMFTTPVLIPQTRTIQNIQIWACISWALTSLPEAEWLVLITVYKNVLGCALLWCWISLSPFFANITINVLFYHVDY